MDWFTEEELIIGYRKTKTGLLVSLSELYRLGFHCKSPHYDSNNYKLDR